MVMKNPSAGARAHRMKPRRVGIADAKARLSSLIREAEQRPTVIHNRGRDVAVLISMADYERVSSVAEAKAESKAEVFLREVGALKEQLGGGVDDFSPALLELRAQAVDF